MNNKILDELFNIGIIPVIAIDDAEKSIDLAKALIKGGIPVAEVTFRTAAGRQSIKNISQNFSNIILGAGTVLNVEQVKQAVDAGATYIVSPGFNRDVVEYCLKNDITVIPGCSNASEMTEAANLGLEVVKFFPAEQLGGIKMIKALAAVVQSLKFVPTGGVNENNLTDYISYDRIAACGGTWMVKKDMIEAEKWDEITDICKKAMNKVQGFSLKHIGINSKNEAEAKETANALCTMFDFKYKEGNSSIFSGTEFEIMKEKKIGDNGHIAIGVNDVKRGVHYLENKGIKFDPESAKFGPNGDLKAIYFDKQIAGFAFHLVKN